MQVPVLNMQGKEVAKLTLDEASLGGDINAQLVKQAYVRYHSHTRQGSSTTLNRREVEGSTRKLYKQKGTGNARHGDKKANLFKGGGHGHHKQKVREDFRLDMPKKMRRKANRNALLAKLVDNEVRVIDGWSMKAPKTKDFEAFLEAIKVDRTALVALPHDLSANGNAARNVMLSGRNIESVEMCRLDQMNAFTLLNNRYLVIAKSDLEAWLTGPSSQTGKDAKVAPKGRIAKPAAVEAGTPRGKKAPKVKPASGKPAGAKPAGAKPVAAKPVAAKKEVK